MLLFAILVMHGERMPEKSTAAGFSRAIGIVIGLLIAIGVEFTGTEYALILRLTQDREHLDKSME